MIQPLRLLAAFLVFVSLSSLARSAEGADLRLADEPSYSLVGHRDVLFDHTAQRDVEDVAAGRAGEFTPVSGRFNGGFTGAAVWLRLNLSREAHDPDLWWLEINNPRLEDIRLYLPRPEGGFEEQVAGALHPRPARDIDRRQVIFNLNFKAVGAQTVYLRIRSNTSVTPRMHLWQPDAFTRHALTEARIWGVYFGMYALIPLIFFFFWLNNRESVHGWYTLYVGLNFCLALLERGWVHRHLLGSWYAMGNLLLWLTMCVAAAVVQHFNSKFLDLAKHFPRGNRIYLGVSYASSALAIGAILAGYPRQAMQFLQSMAMVMVLVSAVMAVYRLRSGDRKARIFLLAFGIFYAGVFSRFARNLGWADFGALSDYGYQFGSLIHMMVLSVGLFGHYNRLRREKEAAEAQAAAEHQRRQDEQEFMAMISHEFRAPLGVIGASTDNLLRSPRLDEKDRARCEKIMRANERLTSLMDNYLSAERLESADSTLQRAPVNMAALCARVIEDFDGAPGPVVHLNKGVSPVFCECDEGLVRIALRNLLQNARRHSPDEHPVTIDLKESQQVVTVCVRDAGDGIPQEELPQIFNRYFRGRNAVHQPGAGLGLHLVDKVARRHGGAVTVSSQAGAGSDFCLSLPKRAA